MADASDRSLPPLGALVRLRGTAWSVVARTAYDDCVALRLEAPPGPGSRTFLLPFDRAALLDDRRLSVMSPRVWLHRLRGAIARTYPLGGLRHAAPGIDLLPYQLEPALAMLRHGHPRLLIADDVGMGKTIEAAIVLRELAGRSDGFRALVLAPAGLRQQWRAELHGKFDIDATVADAAWLRDAARLLPPGINPWSLPGTYIASFDFVKRPEALRGLELEPWDLVVVDEAHACSGVTDRRAAVDAVARRAHRLLLLTATPPPTHVELGALTGIGAGDGASAPMLRRRRPPGPGGERRSLLVPVRPTDRERRMHRLLERYTRLLWRGARADAPARLLGTVLRKRALSSAASLTKSLRRRYELLTSYAAASRQQLLLPLNGLEEDSLDDCVADGLLAAVAPGDTEGERRWLTRLIDAAGAAAENEAKVRTLLRLLRRVREPTIVFTEYRDTLEHLHAILRDCGLPTCIVHGGLAQDERRSALSAFARGCHVLLATDAAAEGLNLHHHCRSIVHYELPWNPARMLQRAGRVDRFGQRRRVHETALVTRDSAESLVLAPLVRRALRSGDAGAGQRMIDLLSESRVAAMVFEGARPTSPAGPAPPPTRSLDCSHDAVEEARRLLQQRYLARPQHSDGVAASPVSAAVVRLRSLAPGLVLLFELTFSSPGAEVEQRDLAAFHVKVESGRPWALSGNLGNGLEAVLPMLVTAAEPIVQKLTEERVRRLQPVFESASRRRRRRDEEVREIDALASRRLVQGGLFDRRAPLTQHRQEKPGQSQPDRRRELAALSASSKLIGVLVVVHR